VHIISTQFATIDIEIKTQQKFGAPIHDDGLIVGTSGSSKMLNGRKRLIPEILHTKISGINSLQPKFAANLTFHWKPLGQGGGGPLPTATNPLAIPYCLFPDP
jgi:hypothetical protein